MQYPPQQNIGPFGTGKQMAGVFATVAFSAVGPLGVSIEADLWAGLGVWGLGLVGLGFTALGVRG